MPVRAFLIPLFENEKGLKSIEVKKNTKLTLGRSLFGIDDVKVSRNQATVTFDGDRLCLEPLGLNSMFMERAEEDVGDDGVKRHRIGSRQRTPIRDGTVFYLVHLSYPIRVELERTNETMYESDDVSHASSVSVSKTAATANLDEGDASSSGTVDNEEAQPSVADLLENAYAAVQHSKNKQFIGRTEPFDAVQWLRWYDRYRKPLYIDKSMRGLRIAVLCGTVNACRQGSYVAANGKRVHLDREAMRDAVQRSVMYDSSLLDAEHSDGGATLKFEQRARIRVVDGDCLDVALQLRAEHDANPVVLNMANERTPGGGYRSGAAAQEENLHRRTNLFQHLEDVDKQCPNRAWSYPIPTIGAIYSPDVCVMRGAEADGYPFLDPEHYLAFVSVAATKRPRLKRSWGDRSGGGDAPRMGDKEARQMEGKIRIMMEVGRKHRHDAIILSAFGCGAFACPPDHVAEIFLHVIKDYLYNYRFIYFAIFDDHNTRKAHNPEGNLKPFQRMFANAIRTENSTSTTPSTSKHVDANRMSTDD